MFYNETFPEFQVYTSSFTTIIPFSLIPFVSVVPQATSSTISFPPVIASQYNKPITYIFTDTQTQTVFDVLTETNATQYTFQQLDPSTSYEFSMSVNLNPEIQVVPISFSTLTVPISNICFAKNTIIQTDQGFFPIQHLSPTIHTIQHHKIQAITETVSLEDYLILIKPHAFRPNQPFLSTIVSCNHKIFHPIEKQWIKAKDLLNQGNDKICRIKNKRECLYNVLCETHMAIRANNLLCETLHPKNKISTLYQSKKSSKEKKEWIDNMNHVLLKKYSS